MGIAAYKTVELDDLLNGLPVQHREVQHYESPEFLSHFTHFKVLKGGAHTAFHHVKPEEYQPRLLHVYQQGKTLKVMEIARKAQEMNHGDCYVLDAGTVVYVFKGNEASHMELYKAAEVANQIEHEREGKAKIVNLVELESAKSDFWKSIEGDEAQIRTADEHKEIVAQKKIEKTDPVLYRLSDDSGSLTLTKVQEGAHLDWNALKPEDIFILDDGPHIFTWIGEKSSLGEKQGAFRFATAYAKHANKPHASIVKLAQGGENAEFKKAFGK